MMSFKRKVLRASLFALTTLGFVSCGTFNKIAVNSVSDLLYTAQGSVESESDLEWVKKSLPANLSLIEGLKTASLHNEEILATLTKGYTGHAFAINEVNWMIDQWEEVKNENAKQETLRIYTKGLNYGRQYLLQKNIIWEELRSNGSEASHILHLLDKHLSDKKIDLETVLFTAQALGSMINLQKDNVSLISELPIVKIMFDWVCMKNPSINYGTCDIFYGTYESGRPKMLGGNPDKGKEIFEKAIASHPHNWLIRTSFIQYYLIPQGDEEGFNKQMNELKKYYKGFNEALIYHPSSVSLPEWGREEHLRFYQAIAMKHFELFEKYRKKLF